MPSENPPSPVAPAGAEEPPKGLLNPHVQISLSIALTAASQVFLKLAAEEIPASGWLAFGSLRSGWTWLGIFAIIASLFSWLHALRFIPLSVAFNLAGASQALVPITCWVFLHESISPLRWLGIFLVIAGVCVIARPAGRVEEKL